MRVILSFASIMPLRMRTSLILIKYNRNRKWKLLYFCLHTYTYLLFHLFPVVLRFHILFSFLCLCHSDKCHQKWAPSLYSSVNLQLLFYILVHLRYIFVYLIKFLNLTFQFYLENVVLKGCRCNN